MAPVFTLGAKTHTVIMIQTLVYDRCRRQLAVLS